MDHGLSAGYDRRTIVLHWSTAALVLFMWAGAHMIDWFPRGSALRLDARSVHIVVGTALAGLVLYRIAWRRTRGTIIPEARTAPVLAAKSVHVLLYGLLIATLALGLFNTWVRGDDLFGLGRIPTFGNYTAAARQALKHRVFELHQLGANAILVFVGLHALAAIVHRYVLRDGVFERMLPGVKTEV